MFAADWMERAVAKHIEQHDDRKALAQGWNDEERSMPLPVLADGNAFAFEPLQQAEQLSAPANSSVRADHGASVYPEHPVDLQPPVMPTDGVDPDMDLSMVASGGQSMVVRGVTHPCTPALQEPLRENAKSTTCARQSTVARGESQRLLRPPNQPESLCEKARIVTSAEPQSAARAGSPAIGELEGDIRKLSKSELLVKREVPEDCDVELNVSLSALAIDQHESLDSLNTKIPQVVDAMGGRRHKYARERRSSV